MDRAKMVTEAQRAAPQECLWTAATRTALQERPRGLWRRRRPSAAAGKHEVAVVAAAVAATRGFGSAHSRRCAACSMCWGFFAR